MRLLDDLAADSIVHSKVKRMHEYWLSKCRGRQMPRRTEIDPLDVPDCLGNLCLVDVTSDTPPRFKFRVDGTNLALTTGFDLTGKYVDQIPDHAYRDFVAALYRRVVATKAPVFVTSKEDWKGYDLQVVSVTLPLSADGVSVDAILDAVFPCRTDAP